MDLYEHIADDYDAVTGADERTGAAEAMLAGLRKQHPFASALDVACGNGLHARLLARMGVSITAGDLSEAMLRHARLRSLDAGLDVRWVHSPMQDIGRHVEGPFDLVLCVGNSLPHLLDANVLTQALAGFARLLAPGGTVVLQTLNYARLLARAERIVGVTRRGQTEYVRFYDFLDGLVRFNVLRIDWSAEAEPHYDLADTLLRPYTRDEIADACRQAGLTNVKCYAGGAFEPFDEAASPGLLLTARRGE